MRGKRKFTRRGWIILAVALMTGFWAVAIPVCWPQSSGAQPQKQGCDTRQSATKGIAVRRNS
jgi:hypothetical protein